MKHFSKILCPKVSGLMSDVASDIWGALNSCRNPKAALARENGDSGTP
jgi:hypothetical protein